MCAINVMWHNKLNVPCYFQIVKSSFIISLASSDKRYRGCFWKDGAFFVAVFARTCYNSIGRLIYSGWTVYIAVFYATPEISGHEKWSGRLSSCGYLRMLENTIFSMRKIIRVSRSKFEVYRFMRYPSLNYCRVVPTAI